MLRLTPKNWLSLLFLGLAIFVLLSCSDTRKIAKAKETLDNRPEIAAKYCADKFPIQEQVIFTTGATRVDTIYQPYNDYVAFDCPPSDTIVTYQVEVKFKEKLITKRITDTITIVQENTARVVALTSDLTISQAETKNLTVRLAAANKEITYFWAFLIACFVAFGIWAYFRIRAGAISGILAKLKR